MKEMRNLQLHLDQNERISDASDASGSGVHEHGHLHRGLHELQETSEQVLGLSKVSRVRFPPSPHHGRVQQRQESRWA